MLFAYQRHERVLGADQIPLALMYNKSILRRIPGLEKTKRGGGVLCKCNGLSMCICMYIQCVSSECERAWRVRREYQASKRT